MEQRAYTRIGKASQHDGAIDLREKIDEVTEVVATQVGSPRRSAPSRSARSPPRRSARRQTASDRARDHRGAGIHVEILSDHEEGRLSFIGATKALGHPVEGDIAVVDVGGGSSEVVLGSIAEGVREVRSFRSARASLAEELIESDPPGPVEIRKLRERIEDFFADIELDHPDQAVAVGGSATSLRRLVGAVSSTRRSSGRSGC